jgi:hypothetical protein
MSEAPTHCSRHRIVWVAVVLLLLAYPLSIGPADRFVCKARNPAATQTFVVVYAPIKWLCRQSNSVRDLIYRYIVWWDYL